MSSLKPVAWYARERRLAGACSAPWLLKLLRLLLENIRIDIWNHRGVVFFISFIVKVHKPLLPHHTTLHSTTYCLCASPSSLQYVCCMMLYIVWRVHAHKGQTALPPSWLLPDRHIWNILKIERWMRDGYQHFWFHAARRKMKNESVLNAFHLENPSNIVY